jgi:endonuclease/exonuclease/phosphatase family metal-dependent hydrolase
MPLRHLTTLFFLLCCTCLDPFSTQFDDLEDAVMYEARTKTAPPASAETLLVMTWNIRYGGARVPFFYECNGYRYSMTENEARSNIEAVAGKIREIDPDVILMQEVDVCSKRSHYLDQMQYLLDHTALNYGAYASIWKGDCIPSDGLGRIDMGNAILSKWPLRDAVRIALPARTDQDALQGYFFFHRNILKAGIELPSGKTLWALTVHTEPWAEDNTKQKHIDLFKQEMDKLSGRSPSLLVAGGDMNALPPGSDKLSHFPDAECADARFKGDDYSAEADIMKPLYDAYVSAIPPEEYDTSEARWHTFTGDTAFGWTRTLDHLFTNSAMGGFVPERGMVLQGRTLPGGNTGTETLPLSDHAPLVVRMWVEK